MEKNLLWLQLLALWLIWSTTTSSMAFLWDWCWLEWTRTVPIFITSTLRVVELRELCLVWDLVWPTHTVWWIPFTVTIWLCNRLWSWVVRRFTMLLTVTPDPEVQWGCSTCTRTAGQRRSATRTWTSCTINIWQRRVTSRILPVVSFDWVIIS